MNYLEKTLVDFVKLQLIKDGGVTSFEWEDWDWIKKDLRNKKMNIIDILNSKLPEDCLVIVSGRQKSKYKKIVVISKKLSEMMVGNIIPDWGLEFLDQNIECVKRFFDSIYNYESSASSAHDQRMMFERGVYQTASGLRMISASSAHDNWILDLCEKAVFDTFELKCQKGEYYSANLPKSEESLIKFKTLFEAVELGFLEPIEFEYKMMEEVFEEKNKKMAEINRKKREKKEKESFPLPYIPSPYLIKRKKREKKDISDLDCFYDLKSVMSIAKICYKTIQTQNLWILKGSDIGKSDNVTKELPVLEKIESPSAFKKPREETTPLIEKPKRNVANPHARTKDYLRAIPEVEVAALAEKFNVTQQQVIDAGENAYLWIGSKELDQGAKPYKDFNLVLQNQLRMGIKKGFIQVQKPQETVSYDPRYIKDTENMLIQEPDVEQYQKRYCNMVGSQKYNEVLDLIGYKGARYGK